MAKFETVTGIFVGEDGKIIDSTDAKSIHVGDIITSGVKSRGKELYVNMKFILNKEFEAKYGSS